MSSPKITRMFGLSAVLPAGVGFFACAKPISGKATRHANRMVSGTMVFSFMDWLGYLSLSDCSLINKMGNCLPTVLDANDGPAFGVDFIDRLVDFAWV